MLADRHRRLEERVLEPLTGASWRYWAFVALLGSIVAWGVFAYLTQLRGGLAVTGMRDQVLWGLYITNFVFFIGISHAGTLLSAILRVTQAGWRVPVTRMAEFITVVALMVGALFPIIDLGRPDRVVNLFLFGRYQSPVLWDVLSIMTYLTGSLLYLYLPLVPDLALCRDRIAGRVGRLKGWFYTIFAAGWRDLPEQRRRLARAMALMMVIIIPVAVSVHTVVSWIFAMTLRAGWNSTVYGAYFVAGAIYSGTATIILVMAVLRRVYRLEEFITLRQFRYLGYLLGTFSLIMVYFQLSEYLTLGYKLPEGDDVLLASLFSGRFAALFWSYLIGGLIVPGLIVFLPWTRTVGAIILAALLVDVAMWIERYLIVVAPLAVPLMPGALPGYSPTWVEWSITAAALAGFALAITLCSRLFPIVSVWEVVEEEVGEAAHRPAPAPQPAAGRLRSLILVAGLSLAAAWLVPPGVARADGPDPRPQVVLRAAAPADIPLGNPARLLVQLRDEAGRPVPDARIVFTSPASFAGTVGEMELGEGVTDAQGQVLFDYRFTIQGRNQVVARYHGDETHRPAEARVEVEVTGSAQLVQRRAGIQVPLLGSWLIVVVLAGVWSVYLAAVRELNHIAREGASVQGGES